MSQLEIIMFGRVDKITLFACAAALVPAMSAAQAPFDAAAAFGGREDVVDVSISPDGNTLSMVVAQGSRGAAVDIVPVAGGASKRIIGSIGDPERIQSCLWSTNTRLICNIYMVTDVGGGQQSFTRRIALDANGKNVQLLSARESSRALGIAGNGGSIIDQLPDEAGSAVLMTRYVSPEESTGTRLAEKRVGLAIERVDTVTLKRRFVETPRQYAVEYISDGHGAVRIMGQQPPTSGGYDANFISYQYRKISDGEWIPFGKLSFAGGKSSGFNPYAVDRDLNVVYGFDQLDGRTALYKVALDGSLKRELVYANPAVDVDGLIRIGRQNRVVGVSYATDKRTAVFFDPELKSLSAALSRAMPALPIISFVDANADESKLVLFAGSDTNPGGYYIYDKKTRQLSEIAPVRSRLEKTKLANAQPVTFPAADGTKIPGYLTLPPGGANKNLPAIVMPHGGPGARDEWGFDWLSQYFANRGYAVLQPNFRGSTGYGEQWFQDNGFKSWKVAIGDVDDAGRWLVKQGIANPAQLAIVGWSYGGYAALQSGVADPGLYKAIVAIAPVTDLKTLRDASVGYSNYRNLRDFIGDGAHLTEGSPAQNAGKITAPVLMFHGDRDQNVPIAQAVLMENRLRAAGAKVELVTYSKLDHQLDDSKVRAEMLAKSDTFLRAAMGM